MATGATSTHSLGLVGTVLQGSESRAQAHGGSLGTWEIPSLSAPHRRQGPSGRPSPRLVGGASGLHERATPARRERYRDAKATERGWTREVFAPSSDRRKAGKPHPRKPVSRKGRGRVAEPCVGNTEGRRDQWMCPRNNHG
jgi:hypothetical protein